MVTILRIALMRKFLLLLVLSALFFAGLGAVNQEYLRFWFSPDEAWRSITCNKNLSAFIFFPWVLSSKSMEDYSHGNQIPNPAQSDFLTEIIGSRVSENQNQIWMLSTRNIGSRTEVGYWVYYTALDIWEEISMHSEFAETGYQRYHHFSANGQDP